MLTAMLAVKNLLGANYDLWQVNAEQEYHEEISGKEQELSALISKIKKPLKFYISWGKYDLRSPNDGWSLIDSGKNVAAAIAKVNKHSIANAFPGGFSWENWRNENGKILQHFLSKDSKQ